MFVVNQLSTKTISSFFTAIECKWDTLKVAQSNILYRIGIVYIGARHKNLHGGFMGYKHITSYVLWKDTRSHCQEKKVN